jgi:molecular chaperone DnaK
MPQIEVTFDIDANGIVNVHAKDLGTNKEQSIRITASSGLNEDEIKKMVREAEAHAADDHSRRLQAEARNKLDNLIYTTEKTLKDHGANIDEAGRKQVEDALAEARTKLESKDPDEINRAAEALQNASHKLAEAMYSKTKAGAGAQAGPQDGAGASQQSGPGSGDGQGGGKEDVVDADYKEVKDQ